jgi:uncharacterized membrane protein
MRWLCGSPVLLRPHRIPQIKTMRYRSIDFLRTAAVFEMVVVHFLDHLTDFDYSVGVFSAPMFLILSGASSHIWLASQKRQRKDHLATRRSLVNRGMCLYAFGTAINVCKEHLPLSCSLQRAFAVTMLFAKSICRYHALCKEHLPLPCSLQRAFAVIMLFRITAMLFS